jgi:hypothetical protein
MAPREDPALRRLAIERIESGRLPCNPAARTWGSHGTGAACALCEHPIGPDQIEYEVELKTARADITLQFHLACYSIWHGICESLQQHNRC